MSEFGCNVNGEYLLCEECMLVGKCSRFKQLKMSESFYRAAVEVDLNIYDDRD